MSSPTDLPETSSAPPLSRAWQAFRRVATVICGIGLPVSWAGGGLTFLCWVLWGAGSYWGWPADVIGWLHFLGALSLGVCIGALSLSMLLGGLAADDQPLGTRLVSAVAGALFLALLGVAVHGQIAGDRGLNSVVADLNRQGAVRFSIHAQDGNGEETVSRFEFQEGSAALVDECVLGLNWRTVINGDHADARSQLRVEAIQKLDVLPFEEAWAQAGQPGAGSGWRYRTDPPVIVVRMTLASGRHADWLFLNQEKAGQAARALAQAAGRCRQTSP